jgi:phenol hydroxylase P0 protein
MAFDPQRKFVHVTELRPDGFVEFDFAIGEPELFVEMIMPSSVFDDFCAMNKVTFLDERAQLKVGPEEWNWRLNDATQRRFKAGT